MTDATDTQGQTPPPQPLTKADWCARMDALCAEVGYFEPVGAQHWAWLDDAGPQLLVTFETLDAILARPDQMPLAAGIAKAKGWSLLCLIADGQTYFRDPAVYGFFDRQVDDGFFEDFDQVLFYGADHGAHAACAFAVTAPGTAVLAINPRATLAPKQAGWDRRYLAERRRDFSSRYGFAPDMTEGAAAVHLVYDPTIPEDAMHAALFHMPWVSHHQVRHLGPAIEQSFVIMGHLPEMIEAAMVGKLSAHQFAQYWRTRRRFGPYLKGLIRKTDLAGKPMRSLRVCRSVVSRLNAPRFRRRMQDLEAQLGLTPPAPPAPAAPAAAATAGQ